MKKGKRPLEARKVAERDLRSPANEEKIVKMIKLVKRRKILSEAKTIGGMSEWPALCLLIDLVSTSKTEFALISI